MNHLTTLRSEQHEDCKQQTDERPRRCPFEEVSFIPSRARNFAQGEAREDRSTQGDPQENGHAFRDDGVRHVGRCVGSADDFEEEDGEGCEEKHLEDGVDCDKDGAVFVVAAGEARPDEDLMCMSVNMATLKVKRIEGEWYVPLLYIVLDPRG